MKIGTVAKMRLEKNIGLTVEQIRAMSIEEQRLYLEKKTGVPMSFSPDKSHLRRVRGNAALGRNRFKTIEQVNSRIDALIEIREKEKRN